MRTLGDATTGDSGNTGNPQKSRGSVRMLGLRETLGVLGILGSNGSGRMRELLEKTKTVGFVKRSRIARYFYKCSKRGVYQGALGLLYTLERVDVL